MSYNVQVSDVEARWRPLDVSEATVAETLIVDAETLLNATLPTLQSLVDGGAVSSRLAFMTICNMVIRVLRNPDALTGQAVEDISQNFAGPAYDGRLYVSSEELAGLNAIVASAGGTVNTGGATLNTVSRAIARRNARETSWAVRRSRGGLL